MKYLISILALLLSYVVSTHAQAGEPDHCTDATGLDLRVFGSGGPEAFFEFARNADVLLMHMPVPEDIGSTARNLHATPGIIGKIAAQINTKKLVLSHLMARSLKNPEKNLEEIHTRHPGAVITAQDLQRIEI